MSNIFPYIEAFQKLVSFKVKYKVESRSQRILAQLVKWYIPTYLTNYTTVVGSSIYFPSNEVLTRKSTRFVIAHEVVHLLDQKRLSMPLFLFIYLSPQIFAIGVFSFPWLGWHSLWFLFFGLPWPSPGRVWLEARAFAVEMNLYMRCGYAIYPDRYIEIFQSPGYYFMSWNRKYVERLLTKFLNQAQSGKDPVFQKVISIFEECNLQETTNQNGN